MKGIPMIISSVALLFNGSCTKKKNELKEGIKFSVTSPMKRDALVIRDYLCQIGAIQHIEIRALETPDLYFIRKVYVE
jgi:membrane fusion protein, multidrug efflux system